MVYVIGLVFVLLVILISIDDLIWDIYYSVSRLLGKIEMPSIDVKEIEKTTPKMLAIIVAAYNEENVLKSVIRNLVISNQYPRSMYHIFLGVYPNDEGTMKVAEELEKEFPNVHKIVHVLNGPSSKADNLNNVIKNIYEFEKKNHLKFQAIVIHDSEDLVHPYEFKLENYLLEKHSAIQMPVFPLQEMPRFSNIFKNMVSGSYADEFAENHYRLLVARTATGAFVPSAGTGFVIRRDILENFPDGEVFPVGSLTEDYKLSLQFKQMGYDVHYVLEDVSRLRVDGTVAREFISTRSMFPSSYRAAVRQKTRWIYGITIQTFKLRDILKNKKLNFSSKYSLYRDWKAKFGNLLLGPGYAVFIYFIISLFVDLPVMYIKYSFSWYLMLFLSIMMIERQILRFIAVKNVYGRKSALISSVFPPLLPFRMVLGNIINFHATSKAWWMNIIGNKKKKTSKKPRWNKTDHEFLEEEILKRFRRNLGDTLLYKGLIESKDLDKALNISKESNEKLGTTLMRLGLVSEDDIIRSVCEITQKPYMDICSKRYVNKNLGKYDRELMKEIKAIPIAEMPNGKVVLTTVDVDEKVIKESLGEDISFIYTTESRILRCIDCPGKINIEDDKLVNIEKYLEEGLINMEQGIIALRYSKGKEELESTLRTMGLLADIEEYA